MLVWPEDEAGEAVAGVEVAEEDVLVGQRTTTATLMSRSKSLWVNASQSTVHAVLCVTALSCSYVLTGQNANAGMLPPSDSDDDSDDGPVAAKAKTAQVSLMLA